MEVAKLYADKSQWPVLSAETFPTENFRPIDSILTTIEELLPHGIKIITTTWGALGSARGGTTSICRLIKEKFNIPTVIHFNIQTKTKRDIEGYLRGMYLDGMNNVLVLGGDPPGGVVDYVPKELRHHFASNFIEQIVNLNKGLWMDSDGKYAKEGVKTNFGIGVAGFPEIHPADVRATGSIEQARKRNIEHMKQKVDKGAHYIIEQIIFDADLHFRYRDLCEKNGINIPLIPGIMPFEKYSEISRFLGDEQRIYMPDKIRAKLESAADADQPKIASDYTAEMLQKIFDSGVPGVHLYCMNKSGPTIEVLNKTTRKKNN